MYFRNIEYIESLKQSISKEVSELLDVIESETRVEAVSVFGSCSKKPRSKQFDLDLILFTKDIKMKNTHGFHFNTDNLLIDFALIDIDTIVQNKYISPYLTNSILRESTPLFFKTKESYESIHKIINFSDTIELRPEENENIYFHMKWIFEKIKYKKNTDPMLTSILIAKFLYFFSLITARLEDKPILGESYGLETLKKNNPDLFSEISGVLTNFANIPFSILENILYYIGSKENVSDKKTLIEVKDMITPVNYSEMNSDEYLRVKSFADDLLSKTNI